MPRRGVQKRKEYLPESSKLKYIYKQARAAGMDVGELTGILSRLIDVRQTNWSAGIDPYMALYENESVKAILAEVPRTLRGLYRSLMFFAARQLVRGIPKENIRADTEALARTWGLDPAIAARLADVVISVFPEVKAPPETF